MRQIEIYELPVQTIAADDSVLFLWATAPLLPEALHTIRCWGFEYKTVAFTWVKRNRKANSWFWGMGGWTRSNSEFCLLGTRGTPKRVAANILSIIDAPVARHSEKPSETRDLIVRLCGDVPRVELFARQRVPGWDAWGTEA